MLFFSCPQPSHVKLFPWNTLLIQIFNFKPVLLNLTEKIINAEPVLLSLVFRATRILDLFICDILGQRIKTAKDRQQL